MRGTKPKQRSAPTAVLVDAYNEANPDRKIPTPLQGELLKRRYKRRVDLRSLEGCLRESARVYRDLCDGLIGLETAEVKSRIIGRHRDILGDKDRKKQLADLVEQLRELRGGAALTFDPDLLE
jgi:hypothetical protein